MPAFTAALLTFIPVYTRTIESFPDSFPLLNLPPELVLCIFDPLVAEGDWSTVVCLGLSCSQLYHTLKERYHPDPISLEHNFWNDVAGISEIRQAHCSRAR